MQLAKPTVDVALLTDQFAPVRAFWEDQGGAVFDRVLPTGPGRDQYRFDVNGTVLKLNRQDVPLPDAAPCGYRGLVIARASMTAPRDLTDPEGNRLTLVPPGHDGVTQAAIRLCVRDLSVHRRFYAEAFGLPEEAPGRFRVGETLILMTEASEVSADASVVGLGWRYITFQVMKLLPAHARSLAAGAREARAPALMAGHARYSMIRDPDGNWIELSQRADLAGSLD